MGKSLGLKVALGAVLVALVAVPSVQAEKKALKPVHSWTGSVDDVALQKEAPETGYINNEKAFAKLWKAWNIGDKMPKIDFGKNIVVLATTRGSKLQLRSMLDGESGNLTILALATKDLRDGFRYQVAVVASKDVKQINGKDLAKD